MISLLILQILSIGLAVISAGIWFAVPRWKRGDRTCALAVGLTTAAFTPFFLWASYHLVLPCGLGGCHIAAAVDEVRKRSVIVDRSGSELGILEEGRSEWVPLREFSPLLVNAVLQREDRRFWTHRGVDPVGTLRALFRTLTSDRREGGSTLPMQAVRCVLGEDGTNRLPRAGTHTGKLAEVAAAASLLELLGRDGVLPLYLNCVPMGPVYGLPAAARYHFGRSVGEVSPSEALQMAAMIRAPSRLSPSRPAAARETRTAFYRTLVSREKIDSLRLPESSVAAPLSRRPRRVDGVHDPVRRSVYSDPLRLIRTHARPGTRANVETFVSTLDGSLQVRAWREVEVLLQRLERRGAVREQLQGVFLLISSTGEIRAYLSRRPQDEGEFDLIRFGRIRLSSSLKPLLLAPALETERVRLFDTLEALPCHRPDEDENEWVLRIRDQTDGDRTVRTALAVSDNWLAVCLLRLLTDRAADRFRSAGVPIPNGKAPAEALGTGVIRPLDLVILYASFLNDGVRPTWRILEEDDSPEESEDASLLSRVPGVGPIAAWARRRGEEGGADEKRIWSSRTTREMRDALVTVVEEGTGRAAVHVRPDGVTLGLKTGTTVDARGRVTEMVVVGFREGLGESRIGLLWIGNDESRPLGIAGSAGIHLVPTWASLMVEADPDRVEDALDTTETPLGR